MFGLYDLAVQLRGQALVSQAYGQAMKHTSRLRYLSIWEIRTILCIFPYTKIICALKIAPTAWMK